MILSRSLFSAVPTRRFAPAFAAALCGLALVSSARAGVMMQGFYADVPSPAAGSASAPWLWDNLAAKANEIKLDGFTAVWIPPVIKGASGGYSNGYDPFDDYDIGNKNQEFTFPTRYGTREQLQKSVAMMRANGLDVYVDMVLNHRSGDDGNYNFFYQDAYGNPKSGRFQKGFYDFHPNVPQDPHVPSEDSQFGRDIAHINGARANGASVSYMFSGLEQSGDWLTKSLDIQGYRLDYVKGISTDFLLPYLNYGAMAGKFAVGEYFDGSISSINYWVQTSMQSRSTAFDFPLQFMLRDMCNGNGSFNMSQLDHAGLVGINPSAAVTFVENHDTDKSNPIYQNKLLGYAYILTSEGYPCVFYRDWSSDPGSYNLKTGINNLVWIHEKIAGGSTQQRWKDNTVFAYERLGGSHLLTGLNDSPANARTITVQTGFSPNTELHDYTGHEPDVYTDGSGRATITIPADSGGNGFVAYSVLNAGTGGFAAPQYSVTQEFDGAQDLDIKPADNTADVIAGRIYVQAGKPITGTMYWDSTSWTSATRIHVDLLGTTNAVVTGKDFTIAAGQGTSLSATASRTGWYSLRLHSYNTPANNAKPAYYLQATYTAPQK